MDIDETIETGIIISRLPYPYSWILNMLAEDMSPQEIGQEMRYSTDKVLNLIDLAICFSDEIEEIAESKCLGN